MYNELDLIRSLPTCHNGTQYSRYPRATVLGSEDPLNGDVAIPLTIPFLLFTYTSD